jgi:hypothetical protein
LINNAIAFPIGKFAFGLGALIFYIAFYKYKLLPRWISCWGIIAILLHIVSGVLVLLRLSKDFDTVSMILNLPIAVQEMVMAIWLIVKGFKMAEPEHN